MKRIVVCLDGTWQSLVQRDLTNIGVIARSVYHSEKTPNGNIEQIVMYEHGVGATTDALGKRAGPGRLGEAVHHLAGGAFGVGVEDSTVETYVRLAFNYEPGDEIYIFGFSRGAFAARSLAGMISNVGITSRRHVERAWEGFWLYRNRPQENAGEAAINAYEETLRAFRRETGKGSRDPGTYRLSENDAIPPIRYMGIFDTVVQRGLPEAFGFISALSNKRYSFHNLQICDNVYAARHALAIDENRLGFPPTLWENLEDSNARTGPLPDGRPRYLQRWFAGTHGDIGGGVGSKLSALSLAWVVSGAEEVGLRFYNTPESPLKRVLADAGMAWESKVTRPGLADALAPINYPIRIRKIWRGRMKPTLEDARDHLDASALQRASSAKPRYRPEPLRPFTHAIQRLTDTNESGRC
jgi:uncharacterized protein (DUF2235 family)